MVEIIVTYETLFDVLRKEKSREELQQLPPDFYGQVVAYIRTLRRDVDAAGGLSSPSAQKALVQYRNVQRILRELYERRERKILEMALMRARTRASIIDMQTLLAPERRLFDEAATMLRLVKAALLEPMLEGEAPAGMVIPELPSGPAESIRNYPEAASQKTSQDSASEISNDEIAAREQCSVKFLAAVPKFLGLHGEILGPFAAGESAELPGKIAVVLLKKKRVEML